MSYREVESYYRQEQHDFFRRYRFPFYSTTFRLDATALVAWAKERGYPTYLTLSYLLTKAVQPLEDFRYRLREGKIVLYDRLHFGMTVPAPGGRFGFCHFDYRPETEAFYAEAVPRLEAARSAPSMETLDRPNEIYFTALPKVPFTSFTHVPTDEPTAGTIQIAFGRFDRTAGRTTVPVAAQVNHIFIDGVALGRLVEAAQALYSDPV